MQCPWGKKAFTGYLGGDENTWNDHDATEIMRSGQAAKYADILIDVSMCVCVCMCMYVCMYVCVVLFGK
jgi:hypothetical protein